jgi:FlaA1/EpsC-like NDP-sugar epimerase
MPSTNAERWGSLRALRYAGILAFDTTATVCGLYGALALRLSGEVPAIFATEARAAAPLLVLIRLATVLAARLHRWSFRMSGHLEAARLGATMFAGSLVFALGCRSLPGSVYVLEFFLTTSLMAALRYGPRLLGGWHAEWLRRGSAGTLRTVIVGAGSTGDLLARDLLRSQDSKYLVLGFVDEDPGKLGMRVSGKPVLGSVSDLPHLIEQLKVSTVLLAIPALPPERIRGILDICSASKASFKIIPASYAYLDKRISAAMLQDLSPDDLLARKPVAFDHEEIQGLVQGRRALVTGAGGTIGGEICRQLAFHGVSQLVMVDMNENELYLRARRLHDEYPSLHLHSEVADIRELAPLHRLASKYGPEFVFHAAAHKHVPLMEDAPEEAVKNNVFGTLNVALMADHIGAEQLVVISTDKAVNPTSVMGATKRVAELVVRDLARRSKTKMTAVRFGNVLGSAGSVVPLFKQQIERGGPVTVTHPDCTRYFMTVSESVGLVLLAGLGGYGELCILDMGKPIRIADMARNLITMAGRIPDEEIPIVYTGLRPGEKLFEELLTEEEEQTIQVRNLINVAKSPPPPHDLDQRLSKLWEHAQSGDRERLLSSIKGLVPSYQRTPGTAIGIPQPALAPSGVQLAIVPVANRRASRRRGLGWLHAPTAARKT